MVRSEIIVIENRTPIQRTTTQRERAVTTYYRASWSYLLVRPRSSRSPLYGQFHQETPWRYRRVIARPACGIGAPGVSVKSVSPSAVIEHGPSLKSPGSQRLLRTVLSR
jgi:hypothetical protein